MGRTPRSCLAACGVLVLQLAASAPAGASLVGAFPLETSGSGLGSEETILTVSNTPVESGCVGRGAGVDVVGPAACPPLSGIAGGDEQTGESQTQTRSLSELGLTNAANLRIVFNASEESGDSITLNELRLRIFSDAGAVLFDSGPFTDVTFPITFSGLGNAGFVFVLDAAQAAAAQPFFADGTNRVGLAAALSNTSGGQETFFVADVASVPGPGMAIIPTLSWWGVALLSIGLAALGLFLVRRMAG